MSVRKRYHSKEAIEMFRMLENRGFSKWKGVQERPGVR